MISRTTKRVCIRVDLYGINAERFIAIKETYGLKSNAELVRYLVAIGHQQIQQIQLNKKNKGCASHNHIRLKPVFDNLLRKAETHGEQGTQPDLEGN